MPLLWTSKYHKHKKKYPLFMNHLGCPCYWRCKTQQKENDCFINMHVNDDYVKITNPILSHIECHYWTFDIVDVLCYRIECDNDFMNDFSDLLLQKLFTTSIKASLSGQWQGQVQRCPSSGQHPPIPANQESGSVVSPHVLYVTICGVCLPYVVF